MTSLGIDPEDLTATERRDLKSSMVDEYYPGTQLPHILFYEVSCINDPYSFSLEDKPLDSNKLEAHTQGG